MKILRPADLATFGTAALIVTGFAIAAALTPQDAPVPAWRWAGLFGTAGIFWLALGVIAYTRWRYLREAVWVAGAHVINRSGRPVDYDELEPIIVQARVAWRRAFGNLDDSALMVHHLANTLIVIREPGFRIHGKPGRFAGYFLPSKRVIMVGWKVDMEQSALAHELGHLFLWATGRDPSEESLARMAAEHDLPY